MSLTIKICGSQKGPENRFQYSEGLEFDQFGDDLWMSLGTKTHHYLAIADPEGSWKYADVDPTAFPRALLLQLKNSIKASKKAINLGDIITEAYNEVFLQQEKGLGIYFGGCSLIVMEVELKTGAMHYVNWGSTGFIVNAGNVRNEFVTEKMDKIGIEFKNVKVFQAMNAQKVEKVQDKWILMASNGFSKQVTSEAAREALSNSKEDMNEACFELWQRAMKGCHRPDDITIILFEWNKCETEK